MGCGCTEQQNINCYCECENLTVPEGPQGLQGEQGPAGPSGSIGENGADGNDAIHAQLSSESVVINLANTTMASVGMPPVWKRHFNNTITTVFSLIKGNLFLDIDVNNLTLSYGGMLESATKTDVIGGIQIQLVYASRSSSENFGYIDMSYLYEGQTYIKRFNVTFVSNGSPHNPTLVSEVEEITLPEEGMTVTTKSGKLMKYQGGQWVAIIDTSRQNIKEVVVTGADQVVDLTDKDENIILITGSGTVNGIISINLPNTISIGHEFKIIYDASLNMGTGAFWIHDRKINILYNKKAVYTCIKTSTRWIISELTTKILSNNLFSARIQLRHIDILNSYSTPIYIQQQNLFPTHSTIIPIQIAVNKIWAGVTIPLEGQSDLKLLAYRQGKNLYGCTIMSGDDLARIGNVLTITPVFLTSYYNMDDQPWRITTESQLTEASDSIYNIDMLYRGIETF